MSCTFCQHRNNTEESNPKRRAFKLERIDKEIEYFINNNVSDIAVLDPIFHTGQYMDILKKIIDYDYKGKLSLQSHFAMVKDEYLETIKYMKEKNIKVTLEFGLQTLVKKEQLEIKRLTSLNKVENVLTYLNSNNINYEISLIYGLPYQTLDSFYYSVKWCLDRGVKNLKVWPLMLLPGTEMDLKKEEYDMIESTDELDLQDGSQIFDFHRKGFCSTERLVKGIPHVIKSKWYTKEEWKKNGFYFTPT